MPALEPYRKELDYSYAPGLYPARVCLELRPELARRLLLSRDARGDGVDAIVRLAKARGVRVEYADNVLRKISKESVHAACAFEKPRDTVDSARNHVVLVNPADAGNVGSVMRSMVGFGFRDLVVVTPAADCFDPKAVRASMGAVFGLRVAQVGELVVEEGRDAYAFILSENAVNLSAITRRRSRPYTLIFGNEGAGLQERYASLGTPTFIEQSRDIDSLNLACAATVAMYHFSMLSDVEGGAKQA